MIHHYYSFFRLHHERVMGLHWYLVPGRARRDDHRLDQQGPAWRDHERGARRQGLQEDQLQRRQGDGRCFWKDFLSDRRHRRGQEQTRQGQRKELQDHRRGRPIWTHQSVRASECDSGSGSAHLGAAGRSDHVSDRACSRRGRVQEQRLRKER